MPSRTLFVHGLVLALIAITMLASGQAAGAAQVGDNAPARSPMVTSAAAASSATVVQAAGGYAYVVAGTQLQTWDIHSLNHPRLAAQTTVSETVNSADLAVAGNTLLVLSSDLYVYSLTDPAHPIQQSVLAVGHVGDYVNVVSNGQYAYLSGPTGGLVVDLTDPANPHKLGTLGSDQILGLARAGAYLYLLKNGQLDIDSLANAAAPQVVGTISAPWGYSANGLAAAGNDVYVTASSTIYVVNATTPTAPMLGLVITGVYASNPMVVGTRLYVNTGEALGSTDATEIDTYDLTNPAVPTILDAYDVPGTTNRLTAVGNILFDATYDIGWLPFGLSAVGLPYDLGATFDSTLPLTPSVPVSGTHQIFLPTILRTLDLSIAGLDVTQASQRLDNSVPLVAGRATTVRVYAQVAGAAVVDGVAMSLSGTRNGAALPGSPLTLNSWAVFQTPDHSRYGQSFNFQLPASWASGTVALSATVNPGRIVPETNAANNTRQAVVSFTQVPPLAVKIVPINYHDTPSGQTYPGLSEDRISRSIQGRYPISTLNTTLRAPIDFSGNLGNTGDWDTLLSRIAQLKSADGAPGQEVYYGSLPDADQWFSALGGLSYEGSRVSLAIDYGPLFGDGSGVVAAHEIGHTMGLLHAPCGNPSGVDPHYPYPNADIGQWGFDPYGQRVFPPGEYVDMMSYCAPKWISDYNYLKLLADQQAHGALSSVEAGSGSLLVRATLAGPGAPALLPIYQLDSPPDVLPGIGDYTLDLVGPDGRLLASDFVPVLSLADETGGTLSAAPSLLSVRVPLPAEPVSAVRLRWKGTLLSERALSPSVSPATAQVSIRRTTTQTEIGWTTRDQPVLARYSLDQGQTWTTVALDNVGGQLSFGAAELPLTANTLEVSLADQDSSPVRLGP